MSDTNVARHKNECHLAGVLAKDPEIRYTTTGKTVANFTVATTYQKSTEYHRVVAWEQLAEKVEPLKKGDFVKLVGRLQNRSWDDKATNQKKYVTEVVAFQLAVPSQQEPQPQPNARGTEVNNDIPW